MMEKRTNKEKPTRKRPESATGRSKTSDERKPRAGSDGFENQLAVQRYLNSIIAHNLTGPLQGMLGFTEFLVSDFVEEGDERRARYLTYLRETAATLHQTIVNVVMWSRQVKDAIVPESEPVYIRDLIEEGLVLNRGSILTKELEIAMQMRERGMIRSDQVLLGIITGNLLQYAIRNCVPKGRLTIAYVKKKDGKTVQLKFQGGDIDVDICKRYAAMPLQTERFSAKEINNELGLITACEVAAMLGMEITMKALITKEVRISLRVDG